MAGMKHETQSGPSRRTAKRRARVAESRKPQPVDSEQRYVVVGLTEEGDELDRVTVVESKLAAAKDVFSGFADWIEVFRVLPDGSFEKVKSP